VRAAFSAAVLAALGLAACSRAVDGTPAAPSKNSGASAVPSAVPSAGPSPSPSASSGSDITPAAFHDCSAVLHLKGVKIAKALTGKLTAQCATVPVPLDYAEPGGATAQIVVVRVHDSDNPGTTPLLLNPGGPGGSGVQLVLGMIAKISPTVVQHYDLVGFDPRGVSLSQPAITCLTDAERDAYTAASPDVTTSAGFAQAKAMAAQFARSCQTRTDGLQLYDTVNTARDMDVLRAALGQQTIDYLGFSYGTELGSVYAHLFPQRVGAMVLDGAVDPLTSGIVQSTFQLEGFEKAYGQFAAYCRKADPCSSLGDPTRAAEDIENAALAQPLPTSTSRKLTANLAATGIQEAMYSKDLWSRLGKALVHARAGDGTDLLSLADQYNQRSKDGKYANLIDAFNTISCNDSAPGPTDDQIRTTAGDWATRYPLFGKWFGIGLFTCQAWQSHRTVPPKPTADTPHEVLVLGNIHDPATPYQGAIDLAKTMGNAEVLSWNGQGHTSYLNGSKCVDNYVNTYLVTRALPPDGTTCPA
jgi:pimeloyl-ACP methyl ester carboxylesterase